VILASWESSWRGEWKRLWEILWFDLKGWLKYNFWPISSMRDLYWGWVKDDVGAIASHVTSLTDHYATKVTDQLATWANDFLGVTEKPGITVYDHITGINKSIVALWARFGYDITNTPQTVVQWVQGRLAGINFSIGALWARFGYDITNTTKTVVQYVEEIATGVVQWVRSNYDGAKLQAGVAFTWVIQTGYKVVYWIDTTGEAAVLWIATKGQVCADWLTAYGEYYAGIYNKYRVTLSSFLEDPGAFIAGYVKDYLEGTEKKPGMPWLLALLLFLANPIGWLWGFLEKAWNVPYAWAMNWLIENTPSLSTDEADLRKTDSLIPSVDAYLSGLFDPVTAAEQAFDAALDRWTEQIMDETITEYPFQLPEIA